MSQEAKARSQLVSALRGLHAIPVENGKTLIGTPDIEFCGGWIEVKHLDKLPAYDCSIVSIPHYTAQQRSFIRTRTKLGKGISKAYLAIKVGAKEWYIFEGERALPVGRVSLRNFKKLACLKMPNGLNRKDLVLCISPKQEKI